MLFVVSHQTSQHGQISLEQAAEICRERAVPLVVDAAAEYDLRGFVTMGAEIVVYSAHKFLGGMTAGIVAGRKSLVRAAYLQSARKQPRRLTANTRSHSSTEVFSIVVHG